MVKFIVSEEVPLRRIIINLWSFSAQIHITHFLKDYFTGTEEVVWKDGPMPLKQSWRIRAYVHISHDPMHQSYHMGQTWGKYH